MWHYSLILTSHNDRVQSRPFSLVNTPTWLPSEGANTTSYSLLSEPTANNLTYVYINDYNISETYYLQPMRPPPNETNVTMKVNLYTTPGISTIVDLMQGNTVIQSSGALAGSGYNVTYTIRIPFSQWSSNITNWTDLRVKITSSSQGGTLLDPL